MSEEDRDVDSIRAAARLMRSSRLRALLVAVWPFLSPVLYGAAGWLVHVVQQGHDLAGIRQSLASIEVEVAAMRKDLTANRSELQQANLAIGKRTAYAVAGMLAAEPAKTRSAKMADAEKYAAAFERIVAKEMRPPEIAMMWLFDKTP